MALWMCEQVPAVGGVGGVKPTSQLTNPHTLHNSSWPITQYTRYNLDKTRVLLNILFKYLSVRATHNTAMSTLPPSLSHSLTLLRCVAIVCLLFLLVSSLSALLRHLIPTASHPKLSTTNPTSLSFPLPACLPSKCSSLSCCCCCLLPYHRVWWLIFPHTHTDWLTN